MSYVDIAAGFKIAGQFPLNGRLYFKTLAELINLGTANVNAYRYYEGMLVFCVETNKQYIWKEAEQTDLVSVGTPFTYPNGVISNGIDYSARTFNFVEYKEGFIRLTDVYPNNTLLIGDYANIPNTYQYNVWAEKWIINGTVYEQSISDVLTLSPASLVADENRIDVIVLNENLTFSVVEGTVAINPTKPVINNTTQLEIGFVLVNANTTAPDDVFNEVVYKENAQIIGGEWDTFFSGAAFLEATTDPSEGTKHLSLEGTPNFTFNWFINLAAPAPLSKAALSKLFFKLKVAAAPVIAIKVEYRLASSVIGETIITHGTFGFNSANVSTYQNIIIDALNFPTTFDEIRFRVADAGTVYIDAIYLQAGTPSVDLSGYVTIATSQTITGDKLFQGSGNYAPVRVVSNHMQPAGVVVSAGGMLPQGANAIDANANGSYVYRAFASGINTIGYLVDAAVTHTGHIFEGRSNGTTTSWLDKLGNWFLKGIIFSNATYPLQNESEVTWDATQKALKVNTGDTIGLVNKSHYIRCFNQSGVTINKGELVRLNGANTVTPTIERYDPVVHSPNTLAGMVVYTVLNNNEVEVLQQGRLEDVQTDGVNYGQAWGLGNLLYPHPTISGGLTNVQPAAPKHRHAVGRVIKVHATTGIILFKSDVTNQGLRDLWDVDGAGVNNEEIPRFNSTTGRFEFFNSGNWMLGNAVGLVNDTFYVHDTLGSNVTGIKGRIDKPFATIDGVFTSPEFDVVVEEKPTYNIALMTSAVYEINGQIPAFYKLNFTSVHKCTISFANTTVVGEIMTNDVATAFNKYLAFNVPNGIVDFRSINICTINLATTAAPIGGSLVINCSEVHFTENTLKFLNLNHIDIKATKNASNYGASNIFVNCLSDMTVDSSLVFNNFDGRTSFFQHVITPRAGYKTTVSLTINSSAYTTSTPVTSLGAGATFNYYVGSFVHFGTGVSGGLFGVFAAGSVGNVYFNNTESAAGFVFIGDGLGTVNIHGSINMLVNAALQAFTVKNGLTLNITDCIIKSQSGGLFRAVYLEEGIVNVKNSTILLTGGDGKLMHLHSTATELNSSVNFYGDNYIEGSVADADLLVFVGDATFKMFGTLRTNGKLNKALVKAYTRKYLGGEQNILELSSNVAEPAINTDHANYIDITAQIVNITSMTTNLTGTPKEGDTLWISLTAGAGTPTITWGASFEDSVVTAPVNATTTRQDVGFIWNTVTSKWRCVAKA